MKLARRGFLGFLGGAAAAGPRAAASVMKQVPDGLGVPFPSVFFDTGDGPSQAVSVNNDWRMSQISEIRNFLKGKFTDEHLEEIEQMRMDVLRHVKSQNITQLQSVSAVNKVRIFNREMAAIAIDMERARKRGYLDRLLRKAMG